ARGLWRWSGLGGQLGLIDGLAGRRVLRPFPSALRGPSGGLFIGEYLLGQLDVALRALRADVVAQDWLAVAGGFGEPDVPRDHRAEDFLFKEIPQVCGNLTG